MMCDVGRAEITSLLPMPAVTSGRPPLSCLGAVLLGQREACARTALPVCATAGTDAGTNAGANSSVQARETNVGGARVQRWGTLAAL